MPTRRARRLLTAAAALITTTTHAYHTPRERLARLSLPECAREMLLNCSMQHFTPSPSVAAPLLAVDHVYMVHYRGNDKRRAYQLQKLPQLGVNFTLVTGYDRDWISGHNRACMLTNSPRLDIDVGGNKTLDMHQINPAYVSQVIKLYAALHDMLSSNYASALVMEDDAVIRFEHLPALDSALRSLQNNYTIVYSGSYNPKGTDSLKPGLYLKNHENIPGYRGPGRMMPAVGCVLSVAGAAHILESLPIRAPVDMTLSDWRVPSAPQHRAWVFKPFAFTPGGFGADGLWGCDSIGCKPKPAAKPAPAG